jgi:hypothetical protein
VTPSAHDPLAAYLLVQAALLRHSDLHAVLTAHASEQAQVLEHLALLVRDLPESDERLVLLGTLAVRDGQFVPGGATRHAIATCMGSSPEACNTFLSALTRIAREDARCTPGYRASWSVAASTTPTRSSMCWRPS